MSAAPAPRTTMNGKPVFTVPVKTVITFDSGFAPKLLCDGPVFSTGDACAYKCSFCYVPSVYRKLDRVSTVLNASGLKHEDVVIRREHALDVLKHQLTHSSGAPKFTDPNDRRVIYSSPAIDVAANVDLVRETAEACALILTLTNWHIRLLSKSNLLPKVAQLLCAVVKEEMVRERVIFGVSTGTLVDGIAAAIEEDTPRVSKRIQSLHWLQDHGFRTYGMVCPSLPMADCPSYRKFAREAFAAIRADKCEHVWAEVINVRGESMARTSAALIKAGYGEAAHWLERVSNVPKLWEEYNRVTFLAHAEAYARQPGKLRYLTYVTPQTQEWWAERKALGAVLL